MTDSVGSIGLDLDINHKGFNNQLNSIADKAQSMAGSAFGKLGGVIAGAFAVKKLWDFGKACVGLGSDLSEVQNVVDVTFGAMAQEVNNFSKGALKAFGMSELSAKRYTSTMGAMLKSSGLTGKTMLGMSTSITQLAGDMASFYNLSQEDAFQKIRSGISGETEPLKQLGVNMSVANMEAYALSQGITKSYSAMTQAEQTLLRYNYLMSVTKDAQGDFARTSGSWANQTRILDEQFKAFMGTLGQGFIQLLTPVLKLLNALVARLQIAAQWFLSFVNLITGAKQQTSQAATSVDSMGVSVGDAGKATKKAGKEVKGALSSFDQLNTISQSTSESMQDAASAAGDIGGIGAMDMGATGDLNIGIDESKLAPLKDMLDGVLGSAKSAKDYMATNFAPVISNVLQQMSVPFAGWKAAFMDTFASFKTLGEPLKAWFTGDFITQVKTGISTMGTVLSGLLDTGLRVFNGLRTVTQPIVSWFVTDGLPMMSQFSTQSMLLFGDIFNSAKTIFDTLWSEGVMPGLTVLSTMVIDTLNILKGFWDTWGTKIFDGLRGLVASITSIIQNLWENFLKPIWQNIVSTISWLWKKHLKGMVTEVTNFVGKLVTAVLDITNKFIAPLVNQIVKILGPTWSNIFNGIVNVAGTVIGTIADLIKGLMKSLGGLCDFLAGVFTGDWKRAWNGIKDFFKGIMDMIGGLFKGAINLIIDALNFFIGALNNIKVDMPDWDFLPDGMQGKTFGINIPKIPKLAQGGLAYAPTLAMVGDNRGAQSDPEVISPLSKLQEMLNSSNGEVVTAIRALIELIRNMETPVILKLGETEIGRAMINAINEAQRQAGKTLLKV